MQKLRRRIGLVDRAFWVVLRRVWARWSDAVVPLKAEAMDVAKAVLARDEVQLAARLDRTRREAEASGDAISAIASAEEKTPQAVRDYELARLVTEKVGDALRELPLHEARWVTVQTSGGKPRRDLHRPCASWP